jgi:hypothetical protein
VRTKEFGKIAPMAVHSFSDTLAGLGDPRVGDFPAGVAGRALSSGSLISEKSSNEFLPIMQKKKKKKRTRRRKEEEEEEEKKKKKNNKRRRRDNKRVRFLVMIL